MKYKKPCCFTCGSSHWADKSMTRLHCLLTDLFPPHDGYCEEYREDENDEKLILTDKFIAMLRMLRGV